MPQDGYKSVSVPEDKLERAREYKPSDVSWGSVLVAGAEHLNENLESDAQGYRDAAVPDGFLEVVDATPEQLDRIETAVKEATEAAQSAERAVEELQS